MIHIKCQTHIDSNFVKRRNNVGLNASVHHCDVNSGHVADREFRMVVQALDLSIAIVDESIKQVSNLFSGGVLQKQRSMSWMTRESEVNMPNRPFGVVNVKSLVW